MKSWFRVHFCEVCKLPGFVVFVTLHKQTGKLTWLWQQGAGAVLVEQACLQVHGTEQGWNRA